MNNKMTNDLIRIVAAGGGVTLAATKTTNDLVRIAAAAAKSGARVKITGASSKMTNDLIQIAAAGKGRVEFL